MTKRRKPWQTRESAIRASVLAELAEIRALTAWLDSELSRPRDEWDKWAHPDSLRGHMLQLREEWEELARDMLAAIRGARA
jgi:hypothetical protein